MKPGLKDLKLAILITGDELRELNRYAIDMVEAFGLTDESKPILAGGPSDFIVGILIACWS